MGTAVLAGLKLLSGKLLFPLYETEGKPVQVKLSGKQIRFQNAARCDLMGNPVKAVVMAEDAAVTLALKPYESMALCVSFEPAVL